MLASACVVLAAGCGGDADGLRVGAAASLREALRQCAVGPALSFAGSDEIAAQVRQGAALDVVALADTRIVDALHDEGLVDEPAVFAANELVLAVPRNGRIRGLADLSDPRVDLVVGAPQAPIGAYTREVLDRLGDRVRATVRSEEPDVRGVVAKLAQGAADAGFVYRTDVLAAGGRLRAIALPEDLAPEIRYAAAVVRRGERPDARKYVDELRSGECARSVREAGFVSP